MHSQFLSAISITVYRLTKTEKSPKVVIFGDASVLEMAVMPVAAE
jgi:hypothetical protein